eukprot:gnl/TRDRNA2_/TRDRNA2_91064_c0_seq1.p1 gnl/TRDRNA2_/TRDRNA2_91064_c0~~gnl/TRDRNA2_/TRDRNA2_91064_c0_seq1.p1  ORF type:complete len:270 (-),score=64.76 gnl/TRDRNA2_/TRDRNA2_91064_c0_seq1:138-947(-)
MEDMLAHFQQQQQQMTGAAPTAPVTPLAGLSQCLACKDQSSSKTSEERRDGTLLPPRVFPKNSRYSDLQMERTKTLGSKELYEQVKLPPGVSEEEWLAITTVDFFNELNLLIGAFLDFCTEQTCPMMCAGPYTYAWADGDRVKVPTKMSAPKYFEHLLSWVDQQLADESFLPVQKGVAFPPTFRKGMRVIYKRLFRIYAHTFHSHYKEIMEGEADAHLNHSFKHFIYFVKEFNLIDDEELEPMKDLVALICEQKLKDCAKPKAVTSEPK